jgi:LacI family gluconate utilization system Gnt-I transcriptional repressor
LTQNPDLDAVFFANDDLALGALFYCQAQGISVPQDIALAGYNGLEMCQSINPRLTTICTPRYEMGRLAGEMARDQIDEKAQAGPTSIRMDLQIIKGETT